jgi:HEAT repeat protein
MKRLNGAAEWRLFAGPLAGRFAFALWTSRRPRRTIPPMDTHPTDGPRGLRWWHVALGIVGLMALAAAPAFYAVLHPPSVADQTWSLLAEVRGGVDLNWFENVLFTLCGLNRARGDRGRYEIGEDIAALGPEAVPPLIDALKDADEDAEVRATAAMALGRLGGDAAVEALLAVLADAGPVEPPPPQPVTSSLVSPDAATQVRSAVADALGEVGDPRAVEPLIAVLVDVEEESGLRRAAARALAGLGDARAVEPMLTLLSDGDAEVAKQAAESLGALGDARAVEPLLAAIADADAGIRVRAAAALGELGDVRAFDVLAAALDDADENVRRAAAGALGDLLDRRAVEPLIGALGAADDTTREKAAGSLGFLGDARAADALAAATESADSDVRFYATLALGAIGRQQDLAVIADRLADKEDNVQAVAVFALGLMRRAEAVPRAEGLACGKSDWQAVVAVTALARAAAPRARAALEQAADASPLEPVRRMAAAALAGSLVEALAAELPRAREKDSVAYECARALALVAVDAEPAEREAALRALDAAAEGRGNASVRGAARAAARRIRALAR